MAVRKMKPIPAALASANPLQNDAGVDLRTDAQKAAALATSPQDLAKRIKDIQKAAKKSGKQTSIADTATVTHIGPKIADNKKAQIAGAKNDGKALAEVTIQTAEREGQMWKPLYSSLFDRVSDKPFHAAYRKALSDWRVDMNEMVRYESHDTLKEKGGSVKQIARSSFTRVSELMTLSRACEAGFTQAAMREIWAKEMPGAEASFEKMPQASIIRASRMFLESVASKEQDGVKMQTKRKGGKEAAPAIEKVRKFILQTLSPAEFGKLAEMVADMAKRVHTASQVKKELEAKAA